MYDAETDMYTDKLLRNPVIGQVYVCKDGRLVVYMGLANKASKFFIRVGCVELRCLYANNWDGYRYAIKAKRVIWDSTVAGCIARFTNRGSDFFEIRATMCEMLGELPGVSLKEYIPTVMNILRRLILAGKLDNVDLDILKASMSGEVIRQYIPTKNVIPGRVYSTRDGKAYLYLGRRADDKRYVYIDMSSDDRMKYFIAHTKWFVRDYANLKYVTCHSSPKRFVAESKEALGVSLNMQAYKAQPAFDLDWLIV